MIGRVKTASPSLIASTYYYNSWNIEETLIPSGSTLD